MTTALAPFGTDPRAMVQQVFHNFAGRPGPAYRTSRDSLSYAQLHAAASALAEQLRALPQGDARRPVVIWGHKDIRYPIAYWACLIAGVALVPVEPETPTKRLQQILGVCEAAAILLASPAPEDLDRVTQAVPTDVVVMHVDPDAVATATVEVAPLEAEDVAYIMFSSGTLGQPKGIQVTYANLLDFVNWLPGLLPEDGYAAISGNIRHCFDVSLFEIWTAWTRCLPLTALDHAEFANSSVYVARLAADKVGLWVSTPSITRLMLQNKRFAQDALPCLQTFVFCGEPLTKAIVTALFTRFPGCRVVNTYGPTECTVAVTSVDITQAHLDQPQDLPIGATRPGVRITTPDGTARGEMMIAGACVAKGYLKQPEKQARAFPGPALYRSGDMGAVDAAGVWAFHGRLDREIKVQGVRIDLTDIEAHIRRQDGVEDVIVEPYLLRGVPRALNAYVIGSVDAGVLAGLAQALTAELPPYLVPRFWYAGFPAALNNNSKLDRGALPEAAKAAAYKHVHMA